MIQFVDGDIFDRPVDIRVNTVNCVGVMGAGVALAFKERYPEMFKEYQAACKNGGISPGRLHIWRNILGDWVINFPTKRHWREQSQYRDVEIGLDALTEYLRPLGHVSVALPALGCGHGGLDWNLVSEMIRNKLQTLDADIYVYEPGASLRAGKSTKNDINNEDAEIIKSLGYNQKNIVLASNKSIPVYVKGDASLLEPAWIAIMPSRDVEEREHRAISAIASSISKSKTVATVALLYNSKKTEVIAECFLAAGITVVLILPFGILTRKNIGSNLDKFPGQMVVMSRSAPSEKWGKLAYAQAAELLNERAITMLVSDPKPELLIAHIGKLAKNKSTYYIRYEAQEEAVIKELQNLGAYPLGRRQDTGEPNIDVLVSFSQRDNQYKSVKATEERKIAFKFNSLGTEGLNRLIGILEKYDKLDISLSVDFLNKDDAKDAIDELKKLKKMV